MIMRMAPLICSPSPPPAAPTSILKFLSDQPYLTMLETHCTTMKDLHKVHCHLIKTGLSNDPIAASRVLAFCTSPATGDMNYAHSVFSRLQNPNLFSWNHIIRGFSRSSNPQMAITLFVEMLVNSSIQPSRLTYPSVFKAYSQLGFAHKGVQLHGRVIKSGLQDDQFVRNSILSMYANCGFLREAERIFDRHSDFDPVTWNIMVMGLSKCGQIEESRKVFDEMPLRNVISWNSMISGYVRNGKFVEALELFGQMQEEAEVKPSEFTMASLLNACAFLGAIRQGEWIHDYIVKNSFELNPIVVTALIDMYSKGGSIDRALHAFKTAPKKALSCWNSMILGLATNGQEKEAITLFKKLESSSSLDPDFVSFIGVLTACNHSGLVDAAKDYFSLMTETYNIKPSIQHYSCMVDVLGGAGFVEEAEELIKEMPITPDAIIWGSLLSSSTRFGYAEVAKRAARQLNELDPSQTSSFVLMSNVYASSGRYLEAIAQRVLLKEKLIEKVPGCSSIELNGEVHEFVAGGMLHPAAGKMYHSFDEMLSEKIE